jgi:XTP/dITP diphosphohydrolase
MRILLATNNANKRDELAPLLDPYGIEIVMPAALGGLPEVVEDRDTFAGNAAKKASSAALAHSMWALADDSGLEVARLGGAPGVRSARFAGEGATDASNNAKLLAELHGCAGAERGARFVCVLALARPDGTIAAEIEGHAHGRILESPRGESGFGYDPLFLFTEEDFDACGRSFAELTREEKARVSHRGRALRELAARLPQLLEEGAGPGRAGP